MFCFRYVNMAVLEKIVYSESSLNYYPNTQNQPNLIGDVRLKLEAYQQQVEWRYNKSLFFGAAE